MNNNARTHTELNRKREGSSQRRSSSVDTRPMAIEPSNTTDRGPFFSPPRRGQTIDIHLQKRVDDEDCDSTHVSPTSAMDFDACAASSFANSPLKRENRPTLQRRNSSSGPDVLVLQSLENDRIPGSRPIPARQGSSRSVQRHMSCSGLKSTSKLDLEPPTSITSVNTASENDTNEPHPSKAAESSEMKSGFRPVSLTRQVADLDDLVVTSAVKRKPRKIDSRIVNALRRSFPTRHKSSGSIDKDKNHNSTTVAKSMMSFIEGELPPTSPSKHGAVKESEKSRRPPKSLPPLAPLSSEEAKRRRRSKRSGSDPSPFELDQSCNDDFPTCSFHGPCEEDSHAIFEFRRISTTATIDGIVNPHKVEVEGSRSQRRTRGVDSKSRQRASPSMGSKITRSKSSSRSHSRGDEHKSLSGVPPRPKKSTEKKLHTEGTRQRSRSRGAKEDPPVASASSGADQDVVYEFKRVDRHSRRRSDENKSLSGVPPRPKKSTEKQLRIEGTRQRSRSRGTKEDPPVTSSSSGSDQDVVYEFRRVSSSASSVEAGKNDEVKTNRLSTNEGISSRQRSGSIDNSLLQRRPSSTENSDSQPLRTLSGGISRSLRKATTRTTDEKPNIAMFQHLEEGKPIQESSDVRCRFNAAEEVPSTYFFLNRSDESLQNQKPRIADESSLGKMERSNGPGLGTSSCSSFGNGTKPNRKKSLVQLIPVDPKERSVSTSVSTHTCKNMGRQKSKGSVALVDLDSPSALPGVDSGTDCRSTLVDFNKKSSADGMQVSRSAVVESNKRNDLRRSSSFNVKILNKSSSDLNCFTTSALHAPKKRRAPPARSRSFNGPVAADSDDDGFSGVFVPVSRIHF